MGGMQRLMVPHIHHGLERGFTIVIIIIFITSIAIIIIISTSIADEVARMTALP